HYKGLPQTKRIYGIYPVYGSNGIVGYHKEPNVTSHGIIIGRKGSVGAIHLSEIPFWAIDTAFYITKESLSELKFTYFLLKTLDLNNMNSDSAVPGLNRDNAHSIKIKIPKLQKDREKIGEYLSTFDQKIELNTQTNQTLEQIAQAIFKHWFIDFAPVHTKANALASGASPEQAELVTMASLSGKNLAEITALQHTAPEAYHQLQQTARAFPSEFVESEMGLVPKGWEAGTIGTISASRREKIRNENAIVLSAISSGELIRSEEYFSKQVYSKNIEKYLKVYPLDFAYNPSRINIGSIGLHKENFIGAVSPVYEVFTPKEHYHWFLELIMNTNYIKDSIKILSSGSVRQSLKLYEFQNIKIIIPPSNLIKIFNHKFILFNQVIDKNKNENSTLEKIRDELLPKLLNGEVEL
ncbi:hypothetical protein QV05_11010, partial [Gallibacterium genomosp. 1]